MQSYCSVWNRYISQRKLYDRTQLKSDLDEADRLYRLHHDLIRAEVKGQMECGT